MLGCFVDYELHLPSPCLRSISRQRIRELMPQDFAVQEWPVGTSQQIPSAMD